MENVKISTWVYMVRLFCDKAINDTLIESIHSKNILNSDEIKNFGSTNFWQHPDTEQEFCNEIRKLKIEISNDKLQFIYDDLANELYSSIDAYTTWYEEKREEIEIEKSKFSFMYKAMYWSMKDTKMEIERINFRLDSNSFQTIETAPNRNNQEPLKWQKSTILLAYLLNELKNHGFIEDSNVWSKSEHLFIDKNDKSINASKFTSFVKNYEANRTTTGLRGKPLKHEEISTIIEILKKASKEIN